MMATSMGPGFQGHAAMNHPGMVAHPMGPGMPQNAGQQGAPGGGMPHQFAGHVAVSGPGGQVNPAMMGGMPPGANPQAHAIQHLTPAQQAMFQQQQQQQQQMQGQFNPSMAAAMRQQQALLAQQQQQRQALLAQQAFQNNMQAGMPMGLQLNARQVQQMHHMQAGMRQGQHPGVQQQMIAQQMALQQQQAQQAQHAQQQQAQHAQQQQHGPQGQPQQGGPTPQMAGPNPGQQMHPGMASMQQQAQMAAQQGPQGQHGQGQPGQQPQGQPQQPQGQPQPQQPGQQPQQGQQQPSQAGTPANTGAQTPSQTPAPAPAQPNHPPQQQGQQQPPQQHPQAHPQMGPQQINTQQMAALMQQQQQQQQRREGMKGQCLLKLMQFSEHLSGFPGSRGKDDLTYWTAFVYRFFSPNGVFRHSLHIADGGDTTDKQYEIAFPAIARYFHTNFESGVKSMQLIMDKGILDKPLPGECHFIENQKASIVYWFETGSHLVASGTLRAQFDAEQKLELLEFITTSNEEYVSRKQVIDAAKPAHVWMKEWHKVNSSDSKGSPEMSKKGKAKQLKSPQSHPPEVLSDIPDSAVKSEGVTAAVHQFLEIVEVMGQMNPLFNYCSANPELGPYSALEQYVNTQINGQQLVNGQVGMQQPPRTPSFGQFQMGASPAPAHMALPGAGSPHVGASPVPGSMQAPPMQMQQSQQGTSSSGPSANTSPASNKRRRPSTVKVEDDGSGAPTPSGTGPQVNGRATKPPTPRMTKRAKVSQQS